MVKHGGFFKRMKASQKRKDAKNKRGTMGRSKEERRERHNARVDYFRAKRELDQLETISTSSSEPDVESESEDEAVTKMSHLHQMLGLTKSKKQKGGHDSASDMSGDEEAEEFIEDEEEEDIDDDEEGEDDDFPFDDADEEGEGVEDLNEEEEEEEEESLMCDGCNVSLDGADADGFVCVTCESTHCAKCFKSRHGTRTGHKIVSLRDVDSGAALAEHQAAVGGADEDEEDDEVDEEGEGLDGAELGSEDDREDEFQQSDSDEEGENAAVEAKLLSLPKLKRSTTSVKDVLKNVLDATDPWYLKYHADEVPESAEAKLVEVPENQFGGGAGALQWEGVALQATGTAAKALKSPVSIVNAADVRRPASILPSVWDRWCEYRRGNGATTAEDILTPSEASYLHCLSCYADLLHTDRNWDNESSLMEVSLLHIVNHHFKTKTVVAAHNQMRRAQFLRREEAKTSSKKKGSTSQGSRTGQQVMAENLDDDDMEFRDRGFGKTRILILLPMRNLALKYVNVLIELLGLDAASQRNYNSFEKDFSEVEEAKDPSFKRRPLAYRRQFEGNINDTFCFGVSLSGGLGKNGRGSIAFYSHVLNSDIVFASPLGLRQRVERNPDAYVGLSSIEVCLCDQANVLYMQNWLHVKEILTEMLNKTPKDTTEGLSDMTRVYGWALDGKAAQHRQTVMISEWSNAEFLASLRTSVNSSGKVIAGANKTRETGALGKVLTPIRQHFRRFHSATRTEVDNDRFNFFTEKIVPSTLQPLIDRQVRTIIFIPSYFDYVKVRNYLYANHRESFTYLCEYTSLKAQRRALGMFSSLEKSVLLLTERFYFFSRYFVKMAEQIIFYSPPINPSFYWLLVGKLESSSPNAAAMTLYSRFDSHELVRIVGADRTPKLLSDPTDAFFFVTGA